MFWVSLTSPVNYMTVGVHLRVTLENSAQRLVLFVEECSVYVHVLYALLGFNNDMLLHKKLLIVRTYHSTTDCKENVQPV